MFGASTIVKGACGGACLVACVFEVLPFSNLGHLDSSTFASTSCLLLPQVKNMRASLHQS